MKRSFLFRKRSIDDFSLNTTSFSLDPTVISVPLSLCRAELLLNAAFAQTPVAMVTATT